MRKFVGLSRQLAIATACFAAVVTVAITDLQTRAERREGLAALQAQLEQIQVGTVPLLSEAASTPDIGTIRLILQGISKQPNVRFVSLSDAQGELLRVGTPAPTVVARDFVLSVDGSGPAGAGQGRRVGLLQVQMDDGVVDRNLDARYGTILAGNVLLISFLAVFVLMLLEFRAMRHLRTVATFVDRLSYENLDQPLRLHRANLGALSSDEVQLLAEGVGRMQEKWRKDYRDRETARSEILATNRLMEESFGTTGEILKIIASTPTEVQGVFQAIAESSRRVVDGVSASVFQFIDEQVHLVAFTAGDPDSDEALRRSFPHPGGKLYFYEPVLRGEILSMEDVANDPRASALAKGLAEKRGYRSLLFLPLRGESVMGMLAVARRELGSVTPGQMSVLRVLADQAVITIQIARLFGQAQDARIAAEAASEAKANFLANMSHEIRTPMNAILGMSTLVARTELSLRQQDYLRKIRYSSEHLLGILNDILDFSKMEAGKLAVETIPFQLDAIVQNLGDVLAEKVADKGLELICRVAPEVPRRLVGDPLRLGQILINLTNNAVKFTEHGEVLVLIGLAPAAEASAHASPAMPPPDAGAQEVMLRFEVHDTGIGLTPEQMDRLFQKFSQADDSVTRRFGGTGLGLAISKTLAELMGGAVGARSEHGRGSTFWFTARLGVAQDAEAQEQVVPSGQEVRVLVVDDSENARQVMREMLENMRFDVEVAESGVRAVALAGAAAAAGKPFDVVLMDWQMPHMNGMETAFEIRSMDLTPPPRLILVTGFGREEALGGAGEAGFEEVLLKPVNGSMLFDLLMRVLHGKLDTGARSVPARTPQDASAGEAALQGLRGARVLLVEDNALNQQVAVELLTDAGFLVEVAEDGQQAVNSVEARASEQLPYDLVLMDMQMPVMDGVTATRLIRENHGSAQLPIVAMTANAMQADRDRCLAAGMNDFVTKPIAPAQLWATLQRWIAPRPDAGVGIIAPRPVDMPGATQAVAQLLPARLEGVDMQRGLLLMGNNIALYVRSLHGFMLTQDTVVGRIAGAIAQGALHDAERLAHTLKGQAAYLGADRVREAAAALEARLGVAPPDAGALQESLRRTEQELDRLLLALREALPPVLPAAPPKPGLAPQLITPQALDDLLQRLARLLDQNDADAPDLLERHQAVLQQRLGDDLAALDDALQQFDFSGARAVLARHL